MCFFFFFQAEDGIRDVAVTGVQTCALPISVRFMAQDFEGSIADCRETLARKPGHFGALSGQGLCHIALEQWQEATTMFRRTLEVYPTLSTARANLQTATAAVVRWN